MYSSSGEQGWSLPEGKKIIAAGWGVRVGWESLLSVRWIRPEWEQIKNPRKKKNWGGELVQVLVLTVLQEPFGIDF